MQPGQRLTWAGQSPPRRRSPDTATFEGLQDDTGVVVGDDIGVAVLRLVGLQVRMFPGELLPGVDGLQGQGGLRLGWVGAGTAGLKQDLRPSSPHTPGRA